MAHGRRFIDELGTGVRRRLGRLARRSDSGQANTEGPAASSVRTIASETWARNGDGRRDTSGNGTPSPSTSRR